MKKGILRGIFSILISFCLCIAMTGCDWPWSKTDEPPIEPSVWTIQYIDDEGTHQLKVAEGMPFSIENIPARDGYDFLGRILFVYSRSVLVPSVKNIALTAYIG